MNIEDISRGQIVYVEYNEKWYAATVKGLSTRTGYLTLRIGDYIVINTHCSNVKPFEEELK